MTKQQKKTVVSWLRDAHALEVGLEKNLSSLAEQLENYPELAQRFLQHREETAGHATLVSDELARLNEGPSGAKDTVSKLGTQVSSWSTTVTEDTVVRGLHSAYAAEQFEIATYTILRTAGEELNEPALIAMCETILRDEVQMADWIYDSIPDTVVQYLTEQIST